MIRLVESFLRHLSDERKLALNTLTAYRNDLRQFERFLTENAGPTVGQSSVEQSQLVAGSSRDELVEFFLQLREKGYSSATIARKMAAVRSFYQYLHRTGLISSNPTLSLGSPEVKKALPRTISAGEVNLLIRQAEQRSTPEGLRDLAMLRVLTETGMRVTELVSLDLGDVSVSTGQIRCIGRNARQRALPIDDRVVASVDVYLNNGRPKLLRASADSTALFLNHRGRRLTRQGFWLIMKAIARHSGLACEVTPHTLRHSFAAHRLRDGLELQRLRELLGHANISTTQIYTQVRADADVAGDGARQPDPVGAAP